MNKVRDEIGHTMNSKSNDKPGLVNRRIANPGRLVEQIKAD
jgi:hypothetical protein